MLEQFIIAVEAQNPNETRWDDSCDTAKVELFTDSRILRADANLGIVAWLAERYPMQCSRNICF
jgi:hypothetical protein